VTFGIALEQDSDDSRLEQNRAIANQLDGIFVDLTSTDTHSRAAQCRKREPRRRDWGGECAD